MKVTVLQNMSGPDVVFKKGRVYDLDDSLAESFISSGHAVAAETKVVETAIEKKEPEKAVKTSYKKK